MPLNRLTLLPLAASFAVAMSGTVLAADDIVDQGPTFSSVVFFGGEVGEDGYTGYIGNVTALNGDIGSDGYLLRISGAFGEYEYDNNAVAGGEVDNSSRSADLMIGYQTVGVDFISSIFAGVEYRDNDLSPNDPTNQARGGEAGAKFQFEASTRGDGGFAGVLASYSTAHETYYARGRLGIQESGLTFGAEGTLLGDASYDGYKVGGFISGIPLGDLNMSITAGYEESEGNRAGSTDDSGFYAGLGFSFVY